jgi:PKD repeat protein
MTDRFEIINIFNKYNLTYITAKDIDDPSKKVCISMAPAEFTAMEDEQLIRSVLNAFAHRFPESSAAPVGILSETDVKDIIKARINNKMQILTADFIFSIMQDNDGKRVVFVDRSSGIPNEYLWDFGDGETSTLKNPIHDYTSSGIYTVSLTVTRNGESHTVTKMDLIALT